MNVKYAGTLYRDAVLTAYRTPEGDLLVVSSSDGRRTVLLVTGESVRSMNVAEIREIAARYDLQGLSALAKPRCAMAMA